MHLKLWEVICNVIESACSCTENVLKLENVAVDITVWYN